VSVKRAPVTASYSLKSHPYTLQFVEFFVIQGQEKEFGVSFTKDQNAVIWTPPLGFLMVLVILVLWSLFAHILRHPHFTTVTMDRSFNLANSHKGNIVCTFEYDERHTAAGFTSMS